MSLDQVVVLCVLVGAFALFVTEAVPLGVAGLTIVAALGLGHALPKGGELDAFSSPAVVLVGALYVVAAGLIRTGVVTSIESRIVRWADGSQTRLLVGTTLVTALVSAILNNTSVVVLMVPLLLGAARRLEIPPSRLLMPVSFAAILGGTMTLIGTSTNLLVADLAAEKFAIRFFDFLPVGAGFTAVGLAYLWFVAPRLLPHRATVSSITRGRALEYVTELAIRADSAVAGLTLSQFTRRAGAEVRMLQHIRGEELLDLSDPSHRLEAGDLLVLRATPGGVVNLRRDLKLDTLPDAGTDDSPLARRGTTFAEIVVTPVSQLVGRTLASVGLHRSFGVTAVALQRRGEHLRRGIVELPLRVGDVILVQGPPERVEKLRGQPGFLLLVGLEEKAFDRTRAPWAVGIILAFVLLAATTRVDLALLAIAAAVATLATGCLSLGRAIREVNWNVLGLLAGAITLGAALHHTHLAARCAHLVLEATRGLGDHATLAAVYLLTAIATELVSNSGAAALMVPIGLAVAGEMPGDVDPRPFAFAVAFAASASFATPIGYQTNAFILGPGGYRFRDFLRVGLPLQVVLWIYASWAIPLVFPFRP